MNCPKQVFIISKPIVPPWNDSGKNIAKDLILHGGNYTYRVLTTKDFSFENAPHIRYERIYPSGGTFQAGLKQNIKVMFAGLRPKGAKIYHYFFAPNKLSSTAGKIQTSTARVKTVQTFCSRPTTYEGINKLIFTDKVIALSKDTYQQLYQAGVPKQKLVHIPPGITVPTIANEAEKQLLRKKYGFGAQKIVLFPGDYEFSDTARKVADATPMILNETTDTVVVFACRSKTDASKEKKQQFIDQLAPHKDRIRFLDEIDDMPRFVSLASVLLLPQENMYAKMDIPLVVLEAMAQGVPVVVPEKGPLAELADGPNSPGICASHDNIAPATIKYLTNLELAQTAGEAGKALINTKYNASEMAKAVENLYDELLDA